MHTCTPMRARGERIEIQCLLDIASAVLQMTPLHAAKSTLQIAGNIVWPELQASPEKYLRFIPLPLEGRGGHGKPYICFRAVAVQSQRLQNQSSSCRGQSRGTAGAEEDEPVVCLG